MERSKFDQVSDLILENGAQIFSNMLYEIPELYNNFEKFMLILAPTDNAIKEIHDLFGSPIQTIIKNKNGLDIIKNHLSMSPPNSVFPMLKSINGREYGTSVEDFMVLEPVIITKFGELTLIVVNRPLLYDDQIESPMPIRTPGVFEPVSYTNFMNIVLMGNLEGSDLIGFCLSNTKIDDYCNSVKDGDNIFRILLRNKHGINVPAEEARGVYFRLHAGFLIRLLKYDDDNKIYHLDNVGDGRIRGTSPIVLATRSVFPRGSMVVTAILSGGNREVIIIDGSDLTKIDLNLPAGIIAKKILKLPQKERDLIFLGSDGFCYSIIYDALRNYKVAIVTGLKNVIDIAIRKGLDAAKFMALINSGVVFWGSITRNLNNYEVNDVQQFSGPNENVTDIISSENSLAYISVSTSKESTKSIINVVPESIWGGNLDVGGVQIEHTISKINEFGSLTKNDVSLASAPLGRNPTVCIHKNGVFDHYYKSEDGGAVYTHHIIKSPIINVKSIVRVEYFTFQPHKAIFLILNNDGNLVEYIFVNNKYVDPVNLFPDIRIEDVVPISSERGQFIVLSE